MMNQATQDDIDHFNDEIVTSCQRQDVRTGKLHTTSSTIHHQRTLATTLYLITTSLLFADQNLLSPNLSAIASEFGLDDIQRDSMLGGDIAIAFFMIGVPASFIVGCLADVLNRRSLLFLWVILLGEGACIATFWVKTYNQLYWCRALTGASVGGALPLIYSVLGDYYASNERGWVSGAISMGCGIGISVGQGVSGVLGPKFGWRVPFIVVGIPAIIIAFLVWQLVDEVPRGQADEHFITTTQRRDNMLAGEQNSFEMVDVTTSSNLNRCKSHEVPWCANDSKSYRRLELGRHALHEHTSSVNGGLASRISAFSNQHLRPHLTTLKVLLKCPSVLLAIFQGAPGCVPWGIINTYLNDYLAADQGMSVEGATFFILIFGIGNFAGTGIGGIGSSRIYSRYGSRYTAVLSGGAAIAGCFPLWAMINSSHNSTVLAASFSAGVMSAITGPIVKSTLQNVTQPNMRGQAFALLNTFDDFGRGLGPAFVALLIRKFGRRKAFNIGVSGWILCGILNGMLYFTVERDEERAKMNSCGLYTGEVSDTIEEDGSIEKV